ncbi:restriction endonuclease subunit S [Mycoplasma bradburyae]|uniref:restriction endonuclease subunit S n=1 Tax=Mycoplasma bradburyae TaxID=2963128 RepID=UPI0020CC7D19|nr:restriction endonuclease subunit S [Mycoplasma bradburyae]UTS70979.1 restriction endonuclease subunit S [Mycoplasma bradburyae]
MKWNNSLKKHIPIGWEVKKLSELCNILLGGTPSTKNSEYWNGDINWLNSGEIAQFPVVTSAKKITQKGIDNSATKLIPKGATVISITGNIRVSCLAIEACANQSVVAVLENKKFKHPFIHQYLSRLISNYTAISTGNCQKHINKETVENSLIVVPEEQVLLKYYLLSAPMYEILIKNSLENEN